MQHDRSQVITIVIADDHELVRDGIKARLENHNDLAILGEATNGEEAVQLACELNPDLILMDINMPRMNGLDAVEEIHRKELNCRCLLLSIHDNAQYVRRAMALGTNGYLLKDVGQDEMLVAIKTAAAGGFYVDQKLASSLESIEESTIDNEDNEYNLTTREREVLSAIAHGKLNKEIANDLDISIRTVESHRSSIREKTGGGNAASLSHIAVQLGLM